MKIENKNSPHRALFFMLFLVLAFLCTGCQSNFVPISVAIKTMEEDFHNVGSVSLSAAALGDQNELKAFRQKVREAQCYYGESDPILAATVKDFSLQLTGTFTNTAKGTGSITAVPVAGLELDIAEGQTQQVTVPVTFAPLSDLPRVYMAQQMSYLSNLLSITKQNSAGDVSQVVSDQITDITKNTAKLGKEINQLVASYQSAQCAAESKRPPPPVLQMR